MSLHSATDGRSTEISILMAERPANHRNRVKIRTEKSLVRHFSRMRSVWRDNADYEDV
jgi:hypothetical protein